MAGSKQKTVENLEAAFAGESMAHIKYRYFAKLARVLGISPEHLWDTTPPPRIVQKNST